MVSRALWGARAYLLLAVMWVRVSLTYRTSFAAMTVGHFLVTGLDFAAIMVMFANVDALGGFGLAQIAFLYGGSGLCLGLSDLLVGNIELLGLDIDWTWQRVAMVPCLVLCGTLIFTALFSMGAAFQFWSTDGSEAANAFTYGGNTLTQYPLTIFPTEAVKALTFIVPVAFVNWYPSLFILGRPDPLGLPGAMQFASPVAAAALCLLAALFWRTGVCRYRSTGS